MELLPVWTKPKRSIQRGGRPPSSITLACGFELLARMNVYRQDVNQHFDPCVCCSMGLRL
jgi:hypothetical protein